jgi:hypothetical protein
VVRHRSDADGESDPCPEQLGSQIRFRDAGEDPRLDVVAAERLSLLAHGHLIAGAPGDEVRDRGRQRRASQPLDLVRVRRRTEQAYGRAHADRAPARLESRAFSAASYRALMFAEPKVRALRLSISSKKSVRRGNGDRMKT